MNAILNKSFGLTTKEMIVLDSSPVEIYTVARALYKYYGFKKNLPGYDYKSQETFKKVYSSKKAGTSALDSCSMKDILACKEALARDVESIKFTVELSHEYESAKKALKKLKESSANIYSYANNNPISFSYSNSSVAGSTNIGGVLVSSIGAGSSFSRHANSGSTSKSGLNLGWIANKLDVGSTLHGLYSSASTIYNNISYFSKNLHAFSDDMTMLGTPMKDGVLAFNQFSWGLGKSDVFGIALGVGLDIYDSIQRGVSPGGVVLGATLTVAKGVGLIYFNKGILYGATALGSAICPGAGTVVGFVVGGVVCVFVDIFVSNWLDELIDSIAK